MTAETTNSAPPKGKTVQRVPLLDLKAQYEIIKGEISAAMEEVCASQHFILGPRVKELEKRIADYSGAKFGIGVSSGTDALLVALMALDVGPGDEVITSPYTFFATGGTIARLGARPVYCDIDPATFNLSAKAVEAWIVENCRVQDGNLENLETGGKVRVLMPVHLFGQVAEMDALLGVARKYEMKVVEDAAQAIGSEYRDGGRAGSLGDVGCFSFFPSKNLGAFGDAGLCVTNDRELAERIRVLRVHGGKPKYHHAVIGGNFRLDELQAAVLLVKLQHLDSWTEGRQTNARYYSKAIEAAGLSDRVVRPVERAGFRHIFNQYVIRAERRDELRSFLGAAGIGTEIYYPIPLHLQACFRNLGHQAGDCPAAEKAALDTLALPIYPELSEDQLQYVVDAMSEFYT